MSSSDEGFLAECSSTGTLTSPKLIAPFQSPRAKRPVLLRLLRLLGRGAAGGAGAGVLALGFGGLLRLALGAVAVHARLLHARVLGFALLVVALLLGDVVGGFGLRVLHLALGLGLVLLVLGVELGFGHLLLALRLGHADVLGVALHRVALGALGLGLRLDLLLLGILRLARRGLLGARRRIALGRAWGGLRLDRGGECERDRERDTGQFESHRNGSLLRPSQQPRDERDQEQHHEYDEQDLGDLSRAGSDAGEAEHRRDDGDDEKRKRPAQHDELLRKFGCSTSALSKLRAQRRADGPRARRVTSAPRL